MKSIPMPVRWLAFAALFAIGGAAFVSDIPPWLGALIGVAVGMFVMLFGFEPETPNGEDTEDRPGSEDP